jgi:hypothetical protein
MADIRVPGCQAFWIDKRKALKTEYKRLLSQSPDADAQLKQLFKVLCDIEDVAGYTPALVGDSDQWTSIVNTAEENRLNFCKALGGKTLYSALYGTYTVALQELKALLKASTTAVPTPTSKPTSTQEDGFTEVRRRKRQSSDKAAQSSKKAVPTAVSALADTPAKVTTRNFIAPLRTTNMDTDSSGSETTPQEETVPAKTCRPPPMSLTSPTNLIHLQKQLKNVVKEDFEFRNTRNGTRVITRGMVDFLAIKSHFEGNNLSFFTFYPKSEKPIKTVIRHMPQNTPAEDICDGLVSPGFDVISTKQMTNTRRSPPEESKTTNLPIFLVTLPRTAKSQEIFHLPSLCHIAIRVEAHRSHSAFMQCHNCQQFGHVWANCKQPPCCLWCGDGHLHKECLEKENTASTPACCNCNLQEGEKPHPANYRGCRHAKDELLKKKSQRTPKTTSGRLFSSNCNTPGVSFAAALRGSTPQHQPQAFQVPEAGRPVTEKQCPSSCRASTIRSVRPCSQCKQSTS